MPGYGTLPATAGTGLLPWSWAEERLAASHDFWLATVTPAGVPHLMPVWGIWRDGQLWFSSSSESRKARNLTAEPRCTLSTSDPAQPVVLQGRAARVTHRDALAGMLAAENAKYGTQLRLGDGGPGVEQCLRPAPRVGLCPGYSRLHGLPHPLHLRRRPPLSQAPGQPFRMRPSVTGSDQVGRPSTGHPRWTGPRGFGRQPPGKA